MSTTGPGFIEPIGPFQIEQGQSDLPNRPPAKAITANPTVDIDMVHLNPMEQQRAAADRVAGRGSMQDILEHEQAQAMAEGRQLVQGQLAQKMQDALDMVQLQMTREVSLAISKRDARRADRARVKGAGEVFQTESLGGLVDGENLEGSGKSASADDGGSSGGGGGANS